MTDEPEQGALFQIEGPDEDGCVWICSPAGREVWCHNLGPRGPAAEAMIDKLRVALQAARLQLEYLDGRFPTGTTPPTIAKIEAVLRESLNVSPEPGLSDRELRAVSRRMVDEFGCSLELLDRNGPSLTCADGEFVHSSVLSERRELIEAARALVARTSPAPVAGGELARFADIIRGNMPARLAEAIPAVERALIEALATRPEPVLRGDDWRCVNCKYVVRAEIEPRRCPKCPGRAFAHIVPAPVARPLPTEKLAELRKRLKMRITDSDERGMRAKEPMSISLRNDIEALLALADDRSGG